MLSNIHGFHLYKSGKDYIKFFKNGFEKCYWGNVNLHYIMTKNSQNPASLTFINTINIERCKYQWEVSTMNV